MDEIDLDGGGVAYGLYVTRVAAKALGREVSTLRKAVQAGLLCPGCGTGMRRQIR